MDATHVRNLVIERVITHPILQHTGQLSGATTASTGSSAVTQSARSCTSEVWVDLTWQHKNHAKILVDGPEIVVRRFVRGTLDLRVPARFAANSSRLDPSSCCFTSATSLNVGLPRWVEAEPKSAAALGRMSPADAAGWTLCCLARCEGTEDAKPLVRPGVPEDPHETREPDDPAQDDTGDDGTDETDHPLRRA